MARTQGRRRGTAGAAGGGATSCPEDAARRSSFERLNKWLFTNGPAIQLRPRGYAIGKIPNAAGVVQSGDQ
jgi:hypothetical protein